MITILPENDTISLDLILNMKSITPDKWNHFYAGIILGVILYTGFMFFFNTSMVVAALIVFLMVTVTSYGFELFSKLTGKGHHDLIDAVATVIGGLVGLFLVIIIHYLV